MKVFTIDVGNSRTHCALVDGKSVSDIADFKTSDFCETFDFAAMKHPVAWASVVPQVSEKLAEKLALAGIASMNLTWKNSPMPLDVANPEQVGQDRIAVAIGAAEFFAPPYVVADMGTAVTIDLVDKHGCYAGGAIAPGLHAFVAYLHEKTALLPKINPQDADFDLPLGKNTVEAMHVGCVKGFCKLADGIIADMEKSYFENENAFDKTIFTGGSVELLPKKWINGRAVEKNLANIGLAKAYILNFNLT